ncbi:hypothetical protein GCM10022408_19590 [Hymenobacter fastidiosus]|uniref:STAS/SEC14 domain-containing protein n=1 Tax=Hymenobacter fastidiosus TaxID=486264 RepID=A0ABP7S6Z5_9BACT
MQLSKQTDPHDGSSCELVFDEANSWIHAIWRGYVDPQEAYRGAAGFLAAMQTLRCPYLLNDNSQVQGPWFDSVEWLRLVWGPRAAQLGLRYIAHVMSPPQLGEATLGQQYFGKDLQLQLFDDVASAEEWLRSRRANEPRTTAADSLE